MEERVRRGESSPEEALAFFQAHGHPELFTLPTFNGSMWIFPQAASPGAEGVIQGSGGVSFVVAGGPPGGGGGTGGSGGSGGGGGTGSPEPGTGTGDGGQETGGGGGGGTGTGSGGSEGSGGGSTPPPGGGRGEGGPVPPQPTVPPVPGGSPTTVPQPPITDDDGVLIVPAASHFADEQLAGAIRDRIDGNVPVMARVALTQLLPAAYVGALVERHFINPLLAAPAQLYEAGLRVIRAERAAEEGDPDRAVQEIKIADGLFKKAAMAILAVVPLGEGVSATAPAADRLAARGVEYMGSRLLPRTETAWATHQMWVTKSHFEHIFRLDGARQVMVDGFINRTGLDFVDRAGNMVLVEVKMASRIEFALRSARPGATLEELNAADALFRQLHNYVELARRLEAHGVRYVITEAAEGAPVTSEFRDRLVQLLPELFEEGFLEIVEHEPPPASFTGYYP